MNTISDPFSGKDSFLHEVETWFTRNGKTCLKHHLDKVPKPKKTLDTKELIFSSKSSPSSRKSWSGMVLDLWLLATKHPKMVSKMISYAQLTGNKTFIEAFSLLGGLLQAPDRWRRLIKDRTINHKGTDHVVISRLGFVARSKT